jgi:hypothetical protein
VIPHKHIEGNQVVIHLVTKFRISAHYDKYEFNCTGVGIYSHMPTKIRRDIDLDLLCEKCFGFPEIIRVKNGEFEL